MYSELIVMIISGKEDWDEVKQVSSFDRGGELLGLTDMMLIHRDSAGKSSYHVHGKESDQLIINCNRIAGTFAETIFDVSQGEARNQLIDAGLDPYFLRIVIQALIPDSLAYLIYVSRENLLDTRRLIEILEKQRGDIYQTTFRPQVEEVLLNQIRK